MLKSTQTNEETTQKAAIVQALFFRHVCWLVFILGILSARHTFIAIICFALVLWIDSRTWRLSACLFLIFCFGTGYIYYEIRDASHTKFITSMSPIPDWAQLNAENRAPTVNIAGRVAKVQSLSDGRLRITLEDIERLQANKDLLANKTILADTGILTSKTLSTNKSSFPDTAPIGIFSGKLIWTWDQATTRPLIGQRITQYATLRPIGGFANEGVFDSAAYWHNQGVWLRSWSRGKGLNIVDDTARPDTYLREKWRADVASALGLAPDIALDIISTNNTTKFTTASPNSVQSPVQSPRQSSAIIMALLFGDKFYLTQSTVDLFQAAGLSHSLALSGQHLSVAALLAWACIILYGFFRPRDFERMPRATLLILTSLPFALFYLWLGSAPPSLVRASCMLGISAVLLLFNRHRHLLDVLCLTLVIMLIADPTSLFNLSLQLSFSALAGIALCLPVQQRLWRRMNNAPAQRQSFWKNMPFHFGRRMCYSVLLLASISFAAQMGTLPIVMSTFGTQSTYSFLNLLWLPVLSIWVLPVAFAGLFATILGLSGTGQSLLLIAAWPCEWLLSLLHFCTTLGMDVAYVLRPSWSMNLGFVCLVLAVSMGIGRTSFFSKLPSAIPAISKRYFVAACLLLCVTPLMHVYSNYTAYAKSTVRLHLLDTGQGQAVLVEWAKKPFATGLSRMLIDGGGFNSQRFNSGSGILAPILTQARFPHIDSMVLTHPDTDHMQGLIFLAKKFAVDAAYIPASAHPGLEKISEALLHNMVPLQYIHDATSLQLSPRLRLDLLPSDIMKGNDGMAARLVYQATNTPIGQKAQGHGIGLALIMGDMEARTQKRWLVKNAHFPKQHKANTQGNGLQSQSIIVPHHGSARNVLPELYDTVTPSIALVACGAGNPYGFPSKLIQATLAERQIPLFSTATSGEITLTWHDGVLQNLATFK